VSVLALRARRTPETVIEAVTLEGCCRAISLVSPPGKEVGSSRPLRRRAGCSFHAFCSVSETMANNGYAWKNIGRTLLSITRHLPHGLRNASSSDANIGVILATHP
jgi:hypothetical protein